MKQRRWPENAETHRLAALDAARDGIRLSNRARESLTHDPRIAEVAIADTMSKLFHIVAELTEAKQGRSEAQ